MTNLSRPPVVLVGLVRLREHCTFTWEEPVSGGSRVARIRRTHCPDCIAELRRRGYTLVPEDPQGDPAAAERRR